MRYFTKNAQPKAYINIVTLCNQRCSYCYARRDLKQDWGKIMTLSEVQEIHDFLKGKDIEINLIGGEPTLHPKLDKIVEIFNGNCTIYSNGTKVLKPICKYSLTYHGYTENIQKFIDNTISVKNMSKVKLMLSGTNRVQKEEQKKILEDIGYTVEFRAIDDNFDVYTEQDTKMDKYYKEENRVVQEISLKEYNRDFRGFYCTPLVLNFYPNNRGNVNCTDILDNFRSFSVDKFICTKEKCRLCFLEGEKYDNS